MLGNILIMLKEAIIRVFELEKEKATFFSLYIYYVFHWLQLQFTLYDLTFWPSALHKHQEATTILEQIYKNTSSITLI